MSSTIRSTKLLPLHCTLLAMLPLACPTLADAPDTATIERMQVTASLVEQSVDEALAAVSIIDREHILASGARDLADLLQRQAGIDIARTGGPGSATSVFVRGSNSNHVLVLVDGLRVASVNTGAFAWEHLPLEQIERIEIVRGPRASRYGSDAIGGVIQIFTRREAGTSAAVVAGRYGEAGLSAARGWAGETGRLRMQAGWRQLDGFSAQNPAGFSFDPDRDGYRNASLSLNGARRIDERTEIDFALLRAEGAVEFDRGQSDTLNQSIAAGLELVLSASWRQRLQLGQARERIDTPVFLSEFLTRRRSLDWIQDIELGRGHRLVAAINAVSESGASLTAGIPSYAQTRSNTGAAIAWHGRFDVQQAELSLRHDRNSLFGSVNTVQAGWGLWLSPQTRLYAHHGEGFRAPNLNEQFSPGFGGLFAGNPQLRPERSRSSELGLTGRLGATGAAPSDWGLRVYRGRIRDLISFSGGGVFQAENVARARTDGLELEWRGSIGRFDTGAALSLQKAEDLDSGLPLLRRPERKLALDLAWPASTALGLATDLLLVSERRDFGAVLPGYGLLGLSAHWQARPELRLGLRVDNLLDKDYELARGFNTPGRTATLRLDWNRAGPSR